MTRRLLALLVPLAMMSLTLTASPAFALDTGHVPHRLRISAFDYGYRGVPRRLDAGTYTYSFTNTSGDEDHEIAFFKLYNPRTTAKQVQNEIRYIIATTPAGQPPDP